MLILRFFSQFYHPYLSNNCRERERRRVVAEDLSERRRGNDDGSDAEVHCRERSEKGRGEVRGHIAENVRRERGGGEKRGHIFLMNVLQILIGGCLEREKAMWEVFR